QTAKGVIVIELTAAQTPVTVNSFVVLSCSGFYDGLTFHRVTRDPTLSIIQGGDPRGDGRGGPGYLFEDEIVEELTHEAGVLSMDNDGDDADGSHGCIAPAPEDHLDVRHTVYGRVTEGLEVGRAIRAGDAMRAVSIREATSSGG